MKIVGLTGGIGSGKTTVARFFELLGVPIYCSDGEAKMLMNTNENIKSKIISTFGNVYENNRLETKKLAKIVFNNPEALQKLNGIVHPEVLKHFEKWCGQRTDYEYVIKESAILFESKIYLKMDKIVTVFAPLEQRLERVCLRDKTTKDEVLKRMDKQWDERKKCEMADFVIKNDNKNMIIPQILEIHKKLIE